MVPGSSPGAPAINKKDERIYINVNSLIFLFNLFLIYNKKSGIIYLVTIKGTLKIFIIKARKARAIIHANRGFL